MCDFTVIQNIYANICDYIAKAEPRLIQEFDVSLEEVYKKYPKAVEKCLNVFTDETFVNGPIIEYGLHYWVKETIEEEVLYPEFTEYVRTHEVFKYPVRNIEVRVNHVKCFPSAVEKRNLDAKQLSDYIGKKLEIDKPV